MGGVHDAESHACMEEWHAQCEQALRLFLDGPATFMRAQGGINNITAFVDLKDPQPGQAARYVLRISNNGGRVDKVAYEHAVLQQLAQLPLSFQVPHAIPSKRGRPYEVLPGSSSSSTDGADAGSTGSSSTAADVAPSVCVCLWALIPGTLAGAGSVEAVGAAVGELTTALAQVAVAGRDPPNPPLWDLFHVHDAIGSADAFYQAVESDPSFGAARNEMRDLSAEVERMVQRLETLSAAGLPTQLIHGDVHFDNVLVLDGRVTGVLDFEFLAQDYRAMELAIALSKYISEEDPLAACKTFMRGYSRHITLTEGEVAAVPTLIALRILSNVVWFTGRALAGEDRAETLTGRAAAYVKRLRWLEVHGDDLVRIISDMQAAAAAG